MNYPYSQHQNPSYENFIASCPHCGNENIFNRASDIEKFGLITFLTVTCNTCGKKFNINGDQINPAYQMLLANCRGYLQQKQYMQCVLTVAQAFEVFFGHFLRVRLLYRPCAAEVAKDKEKGVNIDGLNDVADILYKTVRKFSFNEMRNLFLKLLAEKIEPQTLCKAKKVIGKLPSWVKTMKREKISSVQDKPLRDLLYETYDTKVNTLRNKVVHKYAYRPTFKEAQEAYEEAQRILNGFTSLLELSATDRNYYINQGR